MAGLSLGVAAGGAAEGFNDMQKLLEEDAYRRAEMENQRQHLALQRRQSDLAQQKYNDDMVLNQGEYAARGGKLGLPTPGSAQAAPAPTAGADAGTDSSAAPAAPSAFPKPMFLGGPKPAPQQAPDQGGNTPSAIPTAGGQPRNPTPRPTLTSDQLRDLGRLRAEDSMKTESMTRAHTAAQMRLIDEHIKDSEHNRQLKDATNLFSGVTASLQQLPEDDTMAVGDPKLDTKSRTALNSTLSGLAKSYDKINDGEHARFGPSPDGQGMVFQSFDNKTGKPTGTSFTLNTVGDVKKLVNTYGTGLRPDNYANMLFSDDMLNKAKEQMKLDTQQSKVKAQAYADVYKGLNPESEDDYQRALSSARTLGTLDKNLIRITKNADGTTTETNTIEDQLKKVMPESIDFEGTKVTPQAFALGMSNKLMKDIQRGASPEDVAQKLQDQALAAGFTPANVKLQILPALGRAMVQQSRPVARAPAPARAAIPYSGVAGSSPQGFGP